MGWADTANVKSQIFPNPVWDNATAKENFISIYRLALNVSKNRNKPAFTDVKKRRQQYTAGQILSERAIRICEYTMLGLRFFRNSLLVLEFSEGKPQIKQEPVVKNKIDVITLANLVADRVSTDA